MKFKALTFIKNIIKYSIYFFTFIFIIICFILLLHFKNDLIIIDNCLNNNQDLLENTLKITDSIGSTLKEVDNLYDDDLNIQITLEQVDNTINNIKPIYLTRNDFNTIKNKLNDISTINLYDFDEAFKILNNSKTLSNQEPSLIDYISTSKEDKSNKVDYITEGFDEQYLSSKGFSDEMLNYYNNVYPIGCIYISYNGSCPSIGTWERLSSLQTLKKDIIGMVLPEETGEETIPFEGVLLTSADGTGEFVPPIMPSITGQAGSSTQSTVPISGNNNPFYGSSSDSKATNSGARAKHRLDMNLHNANPIYQDYATIRPASIGVIMYKRIG